ncbi:MAG: COX15/CtaA family protein [Burkholderiaceae bacterium]|nr:COX15/CtaA family protein [Burkholderiaceae bacterium]
MAWLCALLVLLIAALSAYLRLSKAGLGCAPWPQCYGQALRQQQHGIGASGADAQGVALARLAHRVVASVVLVLVIVLALSAITARPLQRDEAALSIGLLALALFLAMLGLRTGASRLPAVAIGNLLGGFAMLALSTRLALAGTAARAPRPALSRAAALTLGAVAIQVVLGGLVSASFAHLSCSSLQDCARTAAQQGWPWSALNPWREPVFEAAAQMPIHPDGALAQLVHRAWAPVVLLAALPTAWLAWRHGARGSAIALLVLLSLQLAAGLWLLTPVLPLTAALLHNLLAALLATLLACLL